jgi:hypothetical protein
VSGESNQLKLLGIRGRKYGTGSNVDVPDGIELGMARSSTQKQA